MPSTEGTKTGAAAHTKNSQGERERFAAAGGSVGDSGPSTVKMPIIGRLVVFLIFPSFVGFMALFASYIKSVADKTGEHEVKFDTDFVTPFMLAMAMVIVIGFQTKGFRTDERTPFVAWPKTRKVKTVTRKRVIVDENGNEVAPDDIPALKTLNERGGKDDLKKNA